MRRIVKALGILCLGSTSPSIVVFLCWFFTFGQMFNLADGLFNTMTQALTVFATCITLIMMLVALDTGELDD